MKYILLLLTFIVFSCTDAQQAKMSGLNNKFKIEVISGGQIIRAYISTGKVISEEHSDGYYFMDSATNKLVEVSGDIIITQID